MEQKLFSYGDEEDDNNLFDEEEDNTSFDDEEY